MRILFIGTSMFAVPTLDLLLRSDQHTVVAVVTQPDRPSGRGLHLQQSPVKRAAVEAAPGLAILQPEKAKTREFREQVAGHTPDVLVVAAFGQILSQRLLDVPRYGGINVHGSLLPRWRGAAPMQYALMAGDGITGVTTMQMDAGMDTGDILLSASTPITDDDTVESLETRLSHIGAELLAQTLERVGRGDCPRVAQDGAQASYAPSLSPDTGFIDWARSADSLANLVRGVTPRPGAWLFLAGRRIKVWASRAAQGEIGKLPGEVLAVRGAVVVAAARGSALEILTVQPEGKPRMAAADWARGAHLFPGARFDPVETQAPDLPAPLTRSVSEQTRTDFSG